MSAEIASLVSDLARATLDTYEDLRAAAQAVVDTDEALRDARNGIAHEGPHDRDVHIEPCCAAAATDPGAGYHVYDLTGDCAQCGGRQYGAESDSQQAMGDLRAALGLPRRPWEEPGLRAVRATPVELASIE